MNPRRVAFSILGFIVLLIFVIFLLRAAQKHPTLLSPVIAPSPRPLLAYSFENLKATTFPNSPITLGEVVAQTDQFRSQTFSFLVPKAPGNNQSRRVSGLINIPKAAGIYPIIVMIRGFVPQDMYHPGVGTQPAGRVFAAHGFITLAPDFLGYGSSDAPPEDVFEARFQTSVTTLTLLNSLASLPVSLTASYGGTVKADLQHVGIWGHSNGGQIALTTLAISGKPYPTVLWAPVSKSFPYSVLAYTDEADDQGKSLRKKLAAFESGYNTDDFSLPRYFSWITASLQIHQGTNDHEVPVWWSDELVATLKKQGLSVQYFTYEGADHNLSPTGWTAAVDRSIDFYTSSFSPRP